MMQCVKQCPGVPVKNLDHPLMVARNDHVTALSQRDPSWNSPVPWRRTKMPNRCHSVTVTEVRGFDRFFCWRQIGVIDSIKGPFLTFSFFWFRTTLHVHNILFCPVSEPYFSCQSDQDTATWSASWNPLWPLSYPGLDNTDLYNLSTLALKPM